MADESNQNPPSQEELLQRALLAHQGNEALKQQKTQQKDQAAVQVNVMEPVEAAANSFAQGYTLGGSDYVKAAGGYLGQVLANQPEVPPSFQQNLSEAQQEGRELRERNPTTSTIAGLAGSVLSPASKVAPGAGLARSVGQGTAVSGAQGFLESEAPDLAGKLSDAATSAVGGGVLSTGLGLAGKGFKALTSAKGAERSAVKALSPTVSVSNEIKALDQKLASKGQQSVGRMLLGDGLVRAGDTIYQTAERIKNAVSENGKVIGTFLTELDQKAASAGLRMQNPAQVLRDSLAPVDRFLKDNPNASQVISAIKPRIEAFVESYASAKSPAMQLANLHSFQSGLRNAFEGADSVTKEALKKLESGLSKKLESEVQRTFLALGGSAQDSLAQYQKLKTSYNMLRLAQDAVTSGASKAEAAESNVLAKTLWRLPSVVGALSGHPSSLAAAFAPEVIQLARTRAGNVGASARNVMSNLAFKVPESVSSAAGQAGRGSILEVLRSMTGK